MPSMLVGYRKGCATKEGAMLFAVMRGRVGGLFLVNEPVSSPKAKHFSSHCHTFMIFLNSGNTENKIHEQMILSNDAIACR